MSKPHSSKNYYTIFTLQRVSVVGTIYSQGISAGIDSSSLSDYDLKRIFKEYHALHGEPILSKPCFGWVSFQQYPITVEDIFTDIFFVNSLTKLKPLMLSKIQAETKDCYLLLELRVPSNKCALILKDNLGNAILPIIHGPTEDWMSRNISYEQPVILPYIKKEYVVDVSVITYLGNLDSFEDNFVTYKCFSFHAPKGALVTPDMLRNPDYFIEDFLDIWNLTPVKCNGIINREYTWPAGTSFNSLNVVKEREGIRDWNLVQS